MSDIVKALTMLMAIDIGLLVVGVTLLVDNQKLKKKIRQLESNLNKDVINNEKDRSPSDRT